MDDGAQTANARLVGQPVRRKEDRRFLTGEGRYVDDIQLPGMTYGVVLRSPHAHARVTRIATDRAAALPGCPGSWPSSRPRIWTPPGWGACPAAGESP